MPNEVSRHVIDLVNALLAEGCDMWSVGRGYCIGEPTQEPMATNVKAILKKFGPRDHLMEEISGYLRRIGRAIAQPI